MGGQVLPRAVRIRRRPEFERVYSTGTKVHGRFMTLFVLQSGRPDTRLGVAATRRIGSAVARNRAKRLARELFRRRKVAAGRDIVIVPRREMLDAPFATLEIDYQKTLDRANRYDSSPERHRRGGRHRIAESV